MARRTILINDRGNLPVESHGHVGRCTLRGKRQRDEPGGKEFHAPVFAKEPFAGPANLIFIGSNIRWPWFPFVLPAARRRWRPARQSNHAALPCRDVFPKPAFRSSIRPRYNASSFFPRTTTSGVTVGLSNWTRRCCGSSKTGTRKSYSRACARAAAGVRSGSTCTM